MQQYNFNPERSHFVNPTTPSYGYRTNRSKKQLHSKDPPYFKVKNCGKKETVCQERAPLSTASSIHLSASAHRLPPQFRNQCYKQMEETLQSQNSNLKQHNNFLLKQVRELHKREKKLKAMVKSGSEKVHNLTHINQHLHKQMHKSTNYTITEINRIQDFIAKDPEVFEEQPRIDSVDKRRNSGIGWETQCSLSQNLQNMKRKVYQFYHEQPALVLYTTNSIQKTQNKQKSEHKKKSILASSGYKISEKLQTMLSPTFHLKTPQLSSKSPLEKLKSSGWKRQSNKQQTPRLN